MDSHPENSWMMSGLNMNSSYAPPPPPPPPPMPSGFSAACSELFARRPDIFEIPAGGAGLTMMHSQPQPDMDAFRNNFMYFQPQPEPQAMNAWMCNGGGVGGGGGMLNSRGGGMPAMMLPDDENESVYFAQSANGGDLGAGDIMGMAGGCPAGWMMGRQPAVPGDWGSGGGGGPGGNGGSFHPAASGMSGMGPMMSGHRNLLPDI